MAALVVLAVLVRLGPLLRGGGLHFFGRYDDGVYYTAADALTFGRLPYRDFVLLHPPGLILALAPFAALGRITRDATGLAIARLAFIGIGALNTGLVVAVARRWSWTAALVAGLLYATWRPAVYSEQTTILEPLGTLLVLIALLLLVRRERLTTRAVVLAGVALGLATSVKIWYVAALVTVVGWQLVERRARHAVLMAAAGVGALLVVVAPFAAAAPTRMFNMVVRDQLLRPQPASSRLHRLPSILGIHPFLPGGRAATAIGLAVACAIVASACAICWRDATARLVVALFAVDLVVLVASPSYFGHYAALTAAPAALVVGVAAGSLFGILRAARTGWWRVAVGLVVLVLLTGAYRVAIAPQRSAVDAGALQRAAPPGCVAADDPTLLVLMNRLSPDFRAGCPVAVDVSGIAYDSLHRLDRHGRSISRRHNEAWQRYLRDYLTSARSFVLARASTDPLSASTRATLRQFPLLARSGNVELRRGRQT